MSDAMTPPSSPPAPASAAAGSSATQRASTGTAAATAVSSTGRGSGSSHRPVLVSRRDGPLRPSSASTSGSAGVGTGKMPASEGRHASQQQQRRKLLGAAAVVAAKAVAAAQSSRSAREREADRERRIITFDGCCPCCRRTGGDTHIFYCQECVSKRMQDHTSDRERVGGARLRARAQTAVLLGPFTTEQALSDGAYSDASARGAALVDPFTHDIGAPFSSRVPGALSTIPADAPASSASHVLRQARAWRAQLRTDLERLSAQCSDAAGEAEQARQYLAQKRSAVQARRERLARAKAELHTRPRSERSSFLSALTGGVDRAASSTATLAERIDETRAVVEQLKARLQDIAKELTDTRKILVGEVLRLFNIRPPAGSLANEGKILPMLSLRAPPDARSWTILGLTLPQPQTASLARLACDDINGAATHTAQLLQLLSAYLGIMLPFQLATQGGRTVIRENSLWGGADIDAGKHAVHLSAAAHASLLPRSESRAAAVGHGASHMAASAISMMGSFVNLHASMQHTPETEAAPTADNDGKDGKSSSAIDAVKAVKSFRTALVMLTYDAAYLAEVSGMLPGDKPLSPKACEVPLRLLHHLRSSPLLGLRSHDASAVHSNIRNFAFPRLEYKMLRDYFDPPKAKNEPKIVMEGSYVDAGADAASVILREQRESQAQPNSTSKTSAFAALRSSSSRTAARPTVEGRLGKADVSAAPADLGFLAGAGRDKTSSRTRPVAVARTSSGGGAVTMHVDGQKLLAATKEREREQRPVSTRRSSSKDKKTDPHPKDAGPRGTVMFNGKAL